MTVHLIYQPTCEIFGAFHFPNDIPKYKKLSVKIIAWVQKKMERKVI